MFPGYGGMNSYPYQTTQTPSHQFYYPSWEAFPPQVKDDPVNTPHVHESWPRNYGYPAPMPCHHCCNHGQHPSYYGFRPPCPNFPSPPPCGHCCGGFPAAYPQPSYHYAPPPHCTFEVPRHEYDKNGGKGFHCCDCPNQTSQVKKTNNVKIEEQEPDLESKKGKSLVPAGINNSPYPIMWIPPGYMMNKGRPARVVENEAEEKPASPTIEKPQVPPNPHQTVVGQQGSPHVQKHDQSSQADGQDRNVRSQWFPLDLNGIRQLIGGGEALKPHDQERKREHERIDQNKHSSRPIIWMPYDGRGENHLRAQEEKENGKPPSGGPAPVCKVANLEHPDKESSKEKIPAGDCDSGAATSGSRRSGHVKTIPVLQLDDSVPKAPIKEQESKVKGTSKNVGETAFQESAKNGTDTKSSTPSKRSKLPPICLRVDPPKKRNGSCSSRSPSPPDGKKCQTSVVESKGEGKGEGLCANKESQVREVEVNDPIRNDVVASHGRKEEGSSSTEEHRAKSEGKGLGEADSKSEGATNSGDGRLHAPEPRRVEQSKHEEVLTSVRKAMSEAEAALVIQSAYRGYEVRRWEPLKKLREIASVREEASKIKGQVEKLESYSNVDSKEKVAIGETIMNLLFKLDAIQGLHADIRDIRRSVAKELVVLQEKLDCIASQKSIRTCPDSASTEEAKGHSEGSGSDEGSSGSFEVITDASTVFGLNGPSDADKSAEDIKEGDNASFDEVGAKPQKEEFGEATTARDDSSEESQGTPAYASCSEDTPTQFDMACNDKYTKANLCAESPQETDNEICRMEWECDLGAAKIARCIDPEATEEQGDAEAGSGFEVEKVEEKHVPAEPHGDVVKENDGQTSEPENSGTGSKDSEMYEPEVQSDDVVAIEHECNIHVEAEENLSGLDTESTDPKCIEIIHPVQGTELLERSDEQVPSVMPGKEEKDLIIEGQRTSRAESYLVADIQEHSVSDSVDVSKSLAEGEESRFNLQTLAGDQITQPVSEGVKEACNTRIEAPLTDSEPHEGDADASRLSLESSVAVAGSNNGEQTGQKIAEENEKLRNMLKELLTSGKEQQDVISSLTAKVADLQKKLTKQRQKKVRSAKRPGIVVSCKKSANNDLRQMGVAL